MPQLSKETKERISEAKRGRRLSEEHKRNISLGGKGLKHKPFSEETKQRISEAKKRGYAEGRLKIPWAGTKGIVTWTVKGEKHYNWKGGRHRDKNGYIWISKPEHPNAMRGGYILEHRLVMANILGRPLRKGEWVHHKNGINDNNEGENLLLILVGIHHGIINCPYCNKEFGIK